MAKFILGAALALVLAGCGGGGDSPPTPPTPPAKAVCARTPYWQSPNVTGETILPLAGTTSYPLWQPTTSIVSVTQLLTGKVYRAGADYQLVGNALMIPTGSTIPLAPADFPATPDPTSQYLSSSVNKTGGSLRISDDYQSWQIAVTYKATPPAPVKSALLPNYTAKLDAGGMPSITFYGDSITAGAVASPGHSFAEIVAAVLAGKATVRNQAVAGWGGGAAEANVQAKLNDQPQDVVVMGLGMNDAAWVDSAAIFQQQELNIINAVRAKAPKTEFVLLSGMRGNPDWMPMRAEMFTEYRAAMDNLAATLPGVTVVDMTSVWDDLRTRKAFYDVAVNGVNHPGDFVHGLYADLLVRNLGPAECR